jgi:hypothetical protein
MLHNSLSSIFFRLANFAVLAAVGYYAYRKYLKGPLEEKVNQKEALLKGLEEQGLFLEGRTEDLDEQRRMQEQQTTLLMQKVDDWHDAVIAERQKNQEEYRIFAGQAAERIATKNAYVARHELQTQIAPLMMHNAKEALQKKFSDKMNNQQFVHDVVNHLKRKHIS